MSVVTFTTATSANWTCPVGVTSVQAECWGSGAGGSCGGSGSGGGGGGGGEYAKETTLAVQPFNTYAYVVGAAGTGATTTVTVGNPGNNSSFTGDSLGVTAHGGGTRSGSATAGPGGTGSANTVHFNGGAGGAGNTSTRNGSGGGSAGNAAVGNAGSTASSSTTIAAGATAVTGGGPGGASGDTTTVGSSPATGPAGGGGGGPTATDHGGNGFAGQVQLTYTAVNEITRSPLLTSGPLFISPSPLTGVAMGNQGDLVIVSLDGTAVWTGVNDGGAGLTWIEVTNEDNSGIVTQQWVAVVTASAAHNTYTFDSNPTGAQFLIVDQFVSGLGQKTLWEVQNSAATFPASSTTVSWPSVSTGVGGLLMYYGSVWTTNNPTGGNTPVNGAAFDYQLFFGDIPMAVAFSGAVVPLTSYQPTASQTPAGGNSASGMTILATLASVARPLVRSQAVNRAATI